MNSILIYLFWRRKIFSIWKEIEGEKFYELKLLLPDNKQNDDDGMFLDFVKYYNRQNNKMVPMDQFVPSTEWYQKEQNNNAVFLFFLITMENNINTTHFYL